MFVALGSGRHWTGEHFGLIGDDFGESLDTGFSALEHGECVGKDSVLEVWIVGFAEGPSQREVTEQAPRRSSAFKLASH